jgi:hypothetical protein
VPFLFWLFLTYLLLLLFSGTEFKNIVCCKIGCLVALELKCGKEGMHTQRHYDTLGATAACTLQLMKEVQRDDPQTGAGLRGDAWSGPIKSAVTLAKKGYKAVLLVKTGHWLFSNKIIESTLEDARGGEWIVLEPIHEGTPLLLLDTATVHVLHCNLWPQKMQGLQQKVYPIR